MYKLLTLAFMITMAAATEDMPLQIPDSPKLPALPMNPNSLIDIDRIVDLFIQHRQYDSINTQQLRKEEREVYHELKIKLDKIAQRS